MSYSIIYFLAALGWMALGVGLLCLFISKIVNYIHNRSKLSEVIGLTSEIKTDIKCRQLNTYTSKIDDIFQTINFIIRNRPLLVSVVEEINNYWSDNITGVFSCEKINTRISNTCGDTAKSTKSETDIIKICKNKVREIMKDLINEQHKIGIICALSDYWKVKASTYLGFDVDTKEELCEVEPYDKKEMNTKIHNI